VHEADTRGLLDFVVDTNALIASDLLLSRQRGSVLSRSEKYYDQNVFRLAPLLVGGPECLAWHLSFSYIYQPYRSYIQQGTQSDEIETFLDKMNRLLTLIQTNYKLTGIRGCSPIFLQERLRDAARILVREDRKSLQAIQDWFTKEGLEVAIQPPPTAPFVVPLRNLNKIGGEMWCTR
jgi:hypothetical protein